MIVDSEPVGLPDITDWWFTEQSQQCAQSAMARHQKCSMQDRGTVVVVPLMSCQPDAADVNQLIKISFISAGATIMLMSSNDQNTCVVAVQPSTGSLPHYIRDALSFSWHIKLFSANNVLLWNSERKAYMFDAACTHTLIIVMIIFLLGCMLWTTHTLMLNFLSSGFKTAIYLFRADGFRPAQLTKLWFWRIAIAMWWRAKRPTSCRPHFQEHLLSHLFLTACISSFASCWCCVMKAGNAVSSWLLGIIIPSINCNTVMSKLTYLLKKIRIAFRIYTGAADGRRCWEILRTSIRTNYYDGMYGGHDVTRFSSIYLIDNPSGCVLKRIDWII